MNARRMTASRIAASILLVVAFFFWQVGEIQLRQMDSFGASAALYTSNSLSAGLYESMERAEALSGAPVAFALWEQRDKQYLETPLKGNAVAASVLEVAGDTRLVLPIAATLSPEDHKGCLIDKKTALELFGNSNAQGAVVVWNDVEYTVRDVFDSPAHTMVVQPDAEHSGILCCVSISDGEEASVFAMRHGLTATLVVKASAYRTIAGGFATLPLLVFSLFLLEGIAGGYRKNKPYPARRWLFALLLAGGVTGLLLWLLSSLPAELMPTRWSDMDFWQTTFRSLGGLAREYLAAKKYRGDLFYLGYVWDCAAPALAAVLLLPPASFLMRKTA